MSAPPPSPRPSRPPIPPWANLPSPIIPRSSVCRLVPFDPLSTPFPNRIPHASVSLPPSLSPSPAQPGDDRSPPVLFGLPAYLTSRQGHTPTSTAGQSPSSRRRLTHCHSLSRWRRPFQPAQERGRKPYTCDVGTDGEAIRSLRANRAVTRLKSDRLDKTSFYNQHPRSTAEAVAASWSSNRQRPSSGIPVNITSWPTLGFGTSRPPERARLNPG